MAAEVVHQHVRNAKDTNAVANWHVVILERESLASAGRAREENQRDSSPYGDHAGYELEKSLFWRGWLLSGRTHSRFLPEAHVHARIRGPIAFPDCARGFRRGNMAIWTCGGVDRVYWRRQLRGTKCYRSDWRHSVPTHLRLVVTKMSGYPG